MGYRHTLLRFARASNSANSYWSRCGGVCSPASWRRHRAIPKVLHLCAVFAPIATADCVVRLRRLALGRDAQTLAHHPALFVFQRRDSRPYIRGVAGEFAAAVDVEVRRPVIGGL